MDRPNPIRVIRSVYKVLRHTRAPNATGSGTVEHQLLSPVLSALAAEGLGGALLHLKDVKTYIDKLSSVDPDTLSRAEALAFWINLYNAGAVLLATEAYKAGAPSVLRIEGGFRRPFVNVAGEDLSLVAIEHAKVRRFKDPRVHSALVCGSLSCPTLRSEPFVGDRLDAQLDDQMIFFLASGGAIFREDGTIELSRVFRWFGADYVRPHRMPALRPTTKRRVLRAVEAWLPDGFPRSGRIVFQDYDWGLACAVR